MSGEKDNVFARWSRRKLSVGSTELQATENENPSPDVAVEDAGAVPQAADQEPGPAQTEADEPAEPLPRIEDLTAESDLSAFLRKGVPMALKSAAMRKMWSLDPGIRDYVGPSEYAWDFNQPGSMAGFGPLDAKETVVGFLSKTIRAIETGAEETAAIPEPSPAQPPADTPSEQPGSTSSDNVADADAAAASEAAEPPASRSTAARPGATEVADGGQAARSPRQTEVSPRPRHGGAMPR